MCTQPPSVGAATARHPADAGLGKRPGRHCRTVGGAAWSAWALLLPVDARERPRDGEGETEWGDFFFLQETGEAE